MTKANREWVSYPIMYLDLNTNDYKSKASLDEKLNTFLTRQEELFGRNKSEKSFGPRFEGVIERFETGVPTYWMWSIFTFKDNMEQQGQHKPLGFTALLVEERYSPFSSLLPTRAKQSVAIVLVLLFCVVFKKYVPSCFLTVTKE